MLDGHSQTVEDLYIILDSRFEGLNSRVAEEKFLKYGPNIVSTAKKIKPLNILFNQFKNLLVIILIFAAIITGIVSIFKEGEGEKIDTIIDIVAISAVILINAGLGFYQEYSAEKAIDSLKKYSVGKVIVARDGKKIELEAEKLVSGDIIFLESGDTVAADIRIIQSYELRINESILTGESVPLRKKATILPRDTPLADRTNMLFKGTTIVNGTGVGIVVHTGLTTELGKIATSIIKIEREDTPIQKKLKKLAQQLTIFIVVLSVIIFLIGGFSLGWEQWTYLLVFTIGLAVAAVPESLPAVLTLALAIGITRMAKKKALIRKLPAVEVLGSTTVICTDKTGTLTLNEQTVKLVWLNDVQYNVTGNGYFRDGAIISLPTAQKQDPLSNPDLLKSIEIITLANEASIQKQGQEEPYKIFGDPTEVALLILAEKGQTVDEINKLWSTEYIFPFDSDRKRMSVIAKNKETDKYQIMVKGATDILINLCTNQLKANTIVTLTENDRKEIIASVESLSANYAYRILGIAYRDIDASQAEKFILSENYELVEENLTFVGFVGMIDPPRKETRPAILEAKQAGLDVIMITGDHTETAKAIGKEISLCSADEPITGKLLERMTDEELEQAVQTTHIFARVNPAHKLRIVNALKKNGHIVVMTGDGVNDAPALKRADIGVAMGITGTDVAKEASEMILIDDNFSNIIEAVSEGRTIYNNIKKFIGYLLSANTGEILTVLFGVILGLILTRNIIIPVLAIQLLFINIVTDTFPALALGVSPPEKDVMKRNPRNPAEPLLDKEMIIMIFLSGLLYAIGAMIVYFWSLGFNTTPSTETQKRLAETTVFASLVIYQLLHSLSISQNKLVFSKDIFKHSKMFLALVVSMGLLLVAIYVPFIGKLIKTEPLPAINWLMIIATAIPIFIIDELRKFIINRRKKTVEQPTLNDFC
ncbi:MAG: cation-translocating P-type ATPase [Candidatus Heimdallarchaeota archaeon]|nr:cation-translocating P-type ATPase [Candidatus Heimdallarchaeota archaeon]